MLIDAVASVPLVRKLVPPSVVGRPWSPSVVDHLVSVHLPRPVGVMGSEGLPVAHAILDFLVDAPAPVLGNAF